MKKCLLLVDVQNGFVNDSNRNILGKIKDILEKFDGIVLASRFINNQFTGFYQFADWYDMCVSPDVDLVDFVNMRADFVFEKNTASSYTMDLESYLIHHEIYEVYVAGFNTDCCVLATALEMFDNGIHSIIVEDLCGSTEGEEYHNSALMLLRKILGNNNVVTSERLFET